MQKVSNFGLLTTFWENHQNSSLVQTEKQNEVYKDL
jgi:hypothetical protein